MKRVLSILFILFSFQSIAQTIAAFNSSVQSGCNPLQVQFINNSQNANTYIWDFGDGSTSSAVNPSYLYNNPGTYDVSLIAIGNAGADTLVKSAFIQVHTIPQANASISSYLACAGSDTVEFINNGDSSYQYTWIFGDGNSANAYSGKYVYNSPGQYQVNLQITNTAGCTYLHTFNQSIQVRQAPQVDFTVDSTLRCDVNLATRFSLLGAGNASFVWDFGDGNLDSSNRNPIHFYAAEGLYDIRLAVNNNAGCSAQIVKNKHIRVSKRKNLSIQISDTSICSDRSIVFELDSANSNVLWNFSDGANKQGAKIYRSFANAGIYTGTAHYTDTVGCIQLAQIPPFQVYQKAEALFSYTKDTSCAPYQLNVTNQSLNASSYLWKVGGDTSTSLNYQQTLLDNGLFDIELQVANNHCKDTLLAEKAVLIEGGTNAIQVNSILGCAPLLNTFSLLDSNYAEITWVFGDGDTAYGGKVIHSYDRGGLFRPKVYLRSHHNCFDTLTLSTPITVIAAQSSFSLPDTIVLCQPGIVSFDGFSVGGNNWQWSFGDGDSAFIANPDHYFDSAGVYQVNLQTMNTNGCYYRLQPYNTIVVKNPVASLDTVVTSCPNHRVDFLSKDPNTVAWFWDFGDGSSDTVKNPSHFYPSPGYYTVNLSTWDKDGCYASRTIVNGIGIQKCIGDGTVPGGLPGGLGAGGSFSDTAAAYTACAPFQIDFKLPSGAISSQVWDFGDGNTSTLANPSHIYTQKGNFDVKLIVVYSNGSRDTIIRSNFVQLGKPIPAFSYLIDNNCDSSEVQFINQSAAANSYLWSLGTGVHSSQFEPRKIYHNERNLVIQLTAIDQLGCRNTSIKNITVGAPNPYFEFESQLCLGDSIVATSNIRNYDNYRWEIGAGNFYYGEELETIASDTGIFFVKLQTIDSSGCVKYFQSSKQLFVSNPMAQFSFAGGLESCDAYQLQVQNNSVGADNYTWIFGDGTYSNDKVPTKKYVKEGEFNLQLIASKRGCSDTASASNLIKVHQAKANFTAIQQNNCLPITVQFIDSTKDAISWKWYFGNGDSSNVQNPNYTYYEIPDEPISLIVFDAYGCTDTLIKEAVKFHRANPIADQWEGCAPLQIQFDDTTAAVQDYYWDFGDGTTSSIKNPSHTYIQPGNYTLTLITTSIEGCKDTALVNNKIIVGDVHASFTVPDSNSSCAPFLVQFTNTSTGSSKYSWRFGDGGSSGKENPIYVYNKAGTFDVRLIANNGHSCADTTYLLEAFTINTPEVNFAMQDSIVCGDEPIRFTDLSQRVAYRKWFFGDGNTSLLENPSHHYQQKGMYTISLMVRDTAGCMEYLSKSLAVKEKPNAGFNLDSSYSCLPAPVQFYNNSSNQDSVSYYWQLNGNSIASSGIDSLFNFNQEGAFKVGLIAVHQNTCSDTSFYFDSLKLFNSTAPSHPRIWSVSVNSPNTTALKWESNQSFSFKEYQLFSNSNSQQFDPLIRFDNRIDTSYSIYTSGPYQAQYYKLVSNNYCYVAQSSDQALIYNSIDLEARAELNGILLTWNNYQNTTFDNYLIYRRQQSSTSEKLIASINPSQTSFQDTSTLCPEAYVYRIEANNLHGLAYKASSDTAQVKPIANIFDPLSLVVQRATVIDQNSILLEWELDNYNPEILKEISLYRSNSRGSMQRLAVLPKLANSYIDQTVSTDFQEYNYQLRMIHGCATVPSTPVKAASIWLNIQQDGSINHLKWTPATGLKDGVKEYWIQQQMEDDSWKTIKTVSDTELEAIIDVYEE